MAPRPGSPRQAADCMMLVGKFAASEFQIAAWARARIGCRADSRPFFAVLRAERLAAELHERYWSITVVTAESESRESSEHHAGVLGLVNWLRIDKASG